MKVRFGSGFSDDLAEGRTSSVMADYYVNNSIQQQGRLDQREGSQFSRGLSGHDGTVKFVMSNATHATPLKKPSFRGTLNLGVMNGFHFRCERSRFLAMTTLSCASRRARMVRILSVCRAIGGCVMGSVRTARSSVQTALLSTGTSTPTLTLSPGPKKFKVNGPGDAELWWRQ